MKKIRLLLIITAVLAFSRAYGDTLTLSECYRLLYQNHPLAEQEELYKISNGYKLKNLDTNYYPRLTLNAQTSYQSDVTKVPISNPLFNIPTPYKDSYKIFLDLKQTIYDGGITSARKEAERVQLLVDEQNAQVELYQLKQKVNDLYFGVLLAQQSIKVLETAHNTLQERLDETESKIKDGLIAGNSRYSLEAELLKNEQDIIEADSKRTASLKMLSDLIEKPLGSDTKLGTPAPPETSRQEASNRPEYRLFSLQKNQISSLENITSNRAIPKIFFNGQGGYGRPGLNALDNSFQTYYLVSLNLSWTPLDWGAGSNDEQIYEINRKLVENRKEIFEKNLTINIDTYEEDINKYNKLIEKDIEITEVRAKSVEGVLSQLQNGTITPTVYITELNAETQARLLLETHRIQLIQAKINYLTAKGI